VDVFLILLKLAGGAAVVLAAGVRLSRYGDEIAERTRLGGAIIGIVLLATITSLPELAVGITSTAGVGNPDLAAGGLLGSNTFNLALIVLLDILHRGGPLLARVHSGHLLSAGMGVLLIGLVNSLILFYQQGGVISLFGIGLESLAIAATYLVSIRLIYRYDRRAQPPDGVAAGAANREGKKPETTALKALYLKTGAAALAIIAAGIWLSIQGDALAKATGWGASFVGSLFLAAATSLPEAVVSITALRIGAVDMAVGNLLGSNLFNMLILAVCDAVYRRGPLLAHVSTASAMAGLTSVLMTGIVITALVYRHGRKTALRVSVEALALAIAYLFGSYFVFVLSRAG
jgi:cation:H+ antiporter